MLAKPLSTLFFLIFIVLCVLPEAFAQSGKMKISIAYLAPFSDFSKEALNTELLRVDNIREALKVISKHKELNGVPVTLKVRYANGDRTWVPLNANGAVGKESKWIVELSKAVSSATFKNLTDIRNYFRDTIVVIDSLRVFFQLSDNRFAPKGFTAQTGCDVATAVSASPPSDKFFMQKPTTNSCNNGAYFVIVKNEKTGERALAKSVVYFLDGGDHQELAQLLAAARADEPEASAAALTGYLSAYIESKYGHIMYSTLLGWVSERLKKL